MARIVDEALTRTQSTGAAFDVLALASIRATREATLQQNGEELPSIIGTPESGETLGNDIFDGLTEAALFHGDLPDNAEDALAGAMENDSVKFLRFRPPLLDDPSSPGAEPSFPHIRLDRALQFLIGDRFS